MDRYLEYAGQVTGYYRGAGVNGGAIGMTHETPASVPRLCKKTIGWIQGLSETVAGQDSEEGRDLENGRCPEVGAGLSCVCVLSDVTSSVL